jgi:hypothetical protein
MNLNEKDQEILMKKLYEILSEMDFGHILCNFVFSNGCLMYVDFKRETNERVYIHGMPNNDLEDKNEKNAGKT